MPTDGPRTLLHDAAAGPVAKLDHDQLRRRARKRTRTRWSAVAIAVMAAIAGVGTLAGTLVSPSTVDVVDAPTGAIAPAELPGMPEFPVTLDLPPKVRSSLFTSVSAPCSWSTATAARCS